MLKWVFGADTGPFRRGLNEMRTETKQFAGSLKGMLAGAIGFSAITAGFRAMFVEMDRVQKLGIRFGETAETIQKIKLAADLAGADLEGLAKGLQKATQNAMEAATGSSTMADAFGRAGINAKDFVNLPMEQKILALAGALEQGKGSGENLAIMLEILGRAGGEMIPLLSQGQEELQRQFEETATVSQGTVDSIAQFNDELTKLKQQAQVVGGAVINGFRLIFGTIGAVVGGAVGLAINSFDVLMKSAKLTGDVISKTLSGDFKGAAASAVSFADVAKNGFAGVKREIDSTGDAIGEVFNEIFDPSSKGSGPSQEFEDAVAKAEELAKIEEDRKKLAEEVAKLEEEARIRALSLEEKITEAMAKRAELAKKMDDPFNTPTETLAAQKAMLEVEKDLEGLRKQQGDGAKKDQDKRDAAAKEMEDLKTREAEVDRDNKFNRLDDKGKLGMLKDEQAALNSKAGDKSLSEKDRTEARIAAKGKQGEIDSLAGSILGDLTSKLADNERGGPIIAASSLAEAGGGGPVAMFGQETREQRKVDLLSEIAAGIAQMANAGGETGVIPPST